MKTKRKKKNSVPIKTALPIVYKKGNEFRILDNLYLKHSNEVWGFQLHSGILLKKDCRITDDVAVKSWTEVKVFAERMVLNNKTGHLASKALFRHYWSTDEKKAVEATVETLVCNGIEATGYCEFPYCHADTDSDIADCFNLLNGNDNYFAEDGTKYNNRLAVMFD